MKTTFSISTCWGPRPETSTALAGRWLATVRQLQSLDPILTRWYKGVDGRGVELTLDQGATEQDISAAADVDNDGYMFNVKSDQRGRGSRMLRFNMRAGSNWMNVVSMGTDHYAVPDPLILTYRIFKGALLAAADNFGVERGFAYSTRLSELWQQSRNVNPPFPIAWISYVTPRLTHLVAPPSTAIVEHRPDGSLLMAATDETFDVDNPVHLSVARDIKRAVAPLHLRPWEPEDPAP